MNRLDIKAHRQIFKDAIDIAIFHETEFRRSVARPLIFDEYKEGSIIEPSISLRTHEAQILMDELWRCGLRPTEGTGSAGSLAATESHLKDMRKIAMGLLKSHGVDQ